MGQHRDSGVARLGGDTPLVDERRRLSRVLQWSGRREPVEPPPLGLGGRHTIFGGQPLYHS